MNISSHQQPEPPGSSLSPHYLKQAQHEHAGNSLQNLEPIRPSKVAYTGSWDATPDGTIMYRTPHNLACHLQQCSAIPVSVAGFDLNGTILTSHKKYQHVMDDYELWNENVISKMLQSVSPVKHHTHLQDFDDDDAHTNNRILVLFLNQGTIRSKIHGKAAEKIKDLIEWLASKLHTIDVYAFVSPEKQSGFHKPSPAMWNAAQDILNCRFDADASIYVGKAVDYQVEIGGAMRSRKGGIGEETKKSEAGVEIAISGHETFPGDDQGFARNVGIHSDRFFTPTAYFGRSALDIRNKTRVLSQRYIRYVAPSQNALETRKELQCGYLTGPIVLLLCGGQGSGKSYFCRELLKKDEDQQGIDGTTSSVNTSCSSSSSWVHLSQDTIRNGRPGPRSAVEAAAKHALLLHQNVVVDRMHLDSTQRSHFVQLATEVNVPIHIVALTTSKEVVMDRVLKRENHVGGVQGEKGARMATASWSELEIPTYTEGFDLISATGTEGGVRNLVNLYRRVGLNAGVVVDGGVQVSVSGKLSFEQQGILDGSAASNSTLVVQEEGGRGPPSGLQFPSITLGTYKLGKRITASAVSLAAELGIQAVDTGPTYGNEAEVGTTIQSNTKIYCIAKVPKRATSAEQVRRELEITLSKLNRNCIDLLLLHWPSDVIGADTLEEVWKAMELCVKDGVAHNLGVSNFNVEALRILLPHCKVLRPIVNQIERHVLLPQWELVDFCMQHDILIQAHSPLGQGRLLDHAIVQKVATGSGLSPAQVLIRWNIQQQFAVVTKSTSREHILEILDASKMATRVGALSADDMVILNNIGETKRFVKPPFMFGNESFCWGETVPPKEAG